MKFSGSKRRFGLKKYRSILIGVLVTLLYLSFGIAMAASGEESGAKGWERLDWYRLSAGAPSKVLRNGTSAM